MKRLLVKLLVFLLLGAIVNIVVAWACALTVAPPRFDQYLFSGSGAHIDRTNEVQWRYGWSMSLGTMTYWSDRTYLFVDNKSDKGPWAESLLPSWSGLLEPTPEFARREQREERRAVDAYGLPLMSMWCSRGALLRAHDDRQTTLPGGGGFVTSLDPWRREDFYATPRVLPFFVIWPGFLADSLLYAAAAWLACAAPLALRRRWRFRKGRCPHCGHRRSGLICAECGKPVTPPRAAARP